MKKKYISFYKKIKLDECKDKNGKTKNVMREIRFIDSFRFMADSLGALSKNLKKEQCKNIGKFYSGKKLDLLLRKACIPMIGWTLLINFLKHNYLQKNHSFQSCTVKE